MEFKVALSIILIIIVSTLTGCVDSDRYLDISRNENPRENETALNITNWDLDPYSTLKHGLEEFLTNGSLMSNRYPISKSEADQIHQNITSINNIVLYTKEYFSIGIIVS